MAIRLEEARVKGVRRGQRLMVERPLARDGAQPEPAGHSGTGRRSKRIRRLPRSVLVNLAESPLGWLLARGHVSERQFAAGEQLRQDWEKSQLPPKVTMSWDAAPPDRSARGAPEALDPSGAQRAAKARFEAAVAEAGPGLSDILWRVVCSGDGMREAEQALGWPARAGKLVLGLALDRLAAFYRLR